MKKSFFSTFFLLSDIFHLFYRASCQSVPKALARKIFFFCFLYPHTFFPPVLSSQFPGTCMFSQLVKAAGGRAAAAVGPLAAKKGIKSVARLDKKLDSLPFLLSLWSRSCWASGRGWRFWRWRSGVWGCTGGTAGLDLCQVAVTFLSPHQATPSPLNPGSVSERQLQPAGGRHQENQTHQLMHLHRMQHLVRPPPCWVVTLLTYIIRGFGAPSEISWQLQLAP